MSLFEQLGAGVAQAARPIPLPERSAHDMGLILESGRIQGYVSAYIDTVGARPMGADHSAFHVPGMDRDTTIDFLTAGIDHNARCLMSLQ